MNKAGWFILALLAAVVFFPSGLAAQSPGLIVSFIAWRRTEGGPRPARRLGLGATTPALQVRRKRDTSART